MTKDSKPRNYSFLDKFTYFIPDVGGMFIVFAFVLAGILIGNLVSLLFVGILGMENGMSYGQLVSYPVTFIPAMIYASIQSRNKSFNHTGLKLDSAHFSPLGGAVCAALVVVGTLALAFCSDAITTLLPPMPDMLEHIFQTLLQNDSVWLSFLMVSIFAPFFEEILCRGIVLRGLLGSGMKPVWAILISAVFFAVIHFNPWQAVPAFLLGCLFGYVYYKTGSLKLTMLMHFANNTFSLIISRIPGLEDVKDMSDLLPGMQYWFVFAACILLLTLIIRAFSRIKLERPQGNMDQVPSLFEE